MTISDRFPMTPRLVQAIERERIEQGRTQNEIAAWIDKTGAYWSGVKKGKIASMSRRDILVLLEELALDPRNYGVSLDAEVLPWRLPDEISLRVPTQHGREQVEKVLGWMLQIRDLNESV